MILITGGNGFLASHIIPHLLQSGYKVRATKRENSNMQLCQHVADKVEWVIADVRDTQSMHEAMQGASHVIHVAAMVSFDTRDNTLLEQINIQGTENVVNAALQHNISQFIHVSSVAALGRHNADSAIVSEANTWTESKKNYNYALSKYGAEMQVWRGITEGLPAVIVNPSVIVGSGDWKNGTSALFAKLYKGLLFYPPGGSGFVAASDIARAIAILIENKTIGERYILNAENRTFIDFFTIMAKTFNKKPPYIKANKAMAYMYAVIETINARRNNIQPTITTESVKNLGEQLYYSNSKFCEQFNFTFEPLETTIHQVCTLYLQHIGVTK